MTIDEQKLLDDIEDARLELALYKRKLRIGIGFSLLCLLIFVGGVVLGFCGTLMGVDTGGIAAGLVIPGILGFIAVVAGTLTWYGENNGSYKKTPQSKLRKAERAYRDYLDRML